MNTKARINLFVPCCSMSVWLVVSRVSLLCTKCKTESNRQIENLVCGSRTNQQLCEPFASLVVVDDQSTTMRNSSFRLRSCVPCSNNATPKSPQNECSDRYILHALLFGNSGDKARFGADNRIEFTAPYGIGFRSWRSAEA